MRSVLCKVVLSITAIMMLTAGEATARAIVSGDSQSAGTRVLRANSATLDVRDGNRLLTGIWTADPSIHLDVYRAWRSTLSKTVSFVSDIDSISFNVEPGKTYDFMVLLKDKGVCHTRVVAQADSATRIIGGSGPTSIPFTIRKGKIHIVGRFNDSPPLDLLFDTGASSAVLYPSGARKGVKLIFDGATLNNGTNLRHTSSSNRIALGDLRWQLASILYIERQADAADGIVGFDVFADKVVALDYDRKVMVIYDALPQSASSYSAVPISYAGVLPLVTGTFVGGSLRAASPLVIDTGGAGTLIADEGLLAPNGLLATLKVVGNRRGSGVGYGTSSMQEVITPEFKLAGFSLKSVPVDVQADSSNQRGGLLFLNVLGRFNTILDYQNNMAYFRPNSHFNDPYPAHGPPPFLIWMVTGSFTFLLALAGYVYKLKKRKSRVI